MTLVKILKALLTLRVVSEEKLEQKRNFFTDSDKCNNEIPLGDITVMLEETKGGTCNSHIEEGSPVVSNLLRQLSATDRLSHC